LRLKKIILIYY